MSSAEVTTPVKQAKGRRAMRAGAVVGACAMAGVLTVGNAFASIPSGASLVANFTLAQGNWIQGETQYVYTVDTASLKAGYELTLQSDSNLVLYAYSYDAGDTARTALWASGLDHSHPVTQIDWSASGYAKLLDSAGTIVCTMGLDSEAPGGKAELQKDGNFVFYTTGGSATWATGTYNGDSATKDYCTGFTSS